jgi:hypothetical protein
LVYQPKRADLFIQSTLFNFWLGAQDIVVEVFAVKLGISPETVEKGID